MPRPDHASPGTIARVALLGDEERDQRGPDRDAGGADGRQRLRARSGHRAVPRGTRRAAKVGHHRQHPEPGLDRREVEHLEHELRQVEHRREEDRRHQQDRGARVGEVAVSHHVARDQRVAAGARARRSAKAAISSRRRGRAGRRSAGRPSRNLITWSKASSSATSPTEIVTMPAVVDLGVLAPRARLVDVARR